MNSVAADVRYALRVLRKSPGFAAIAIGTLALGIGANTAIFSGVESFLLRPIPVPEAERIVFFREMVRRTGVKLAVAYPDLLDWKAGAPGLQQVAAIQIETFNLAGEEAERVRGSRVSADYFAIFGVAPMAGRGFVQADDTPGAPPVAVLGHKLAQARYGGAGAAVGKTLQIDGRPHVIVGVMPPQMSFPMGFAELFVPLATDVAQSGRGDHYLAAIGKLRPGVSVAEAQKQLEVVSRQIEAAHPASNRDMVAWIVPLAEQISSGPKRALFVLWAAVGFVLLICCANLANLTLARAIHRSREFAIRQAVGAGRWRLIRQVLIESSILSAAGGLAGLLVARWGIDYMSSAVPGPLMPMGGLSLNPRVLLFTIALSLATGLLFGLLPALRTLRSQAMDSLRESGRAIAGGHLRSRTASALVIAEVSLAVMLLAGAGLLLLALGRMQGVEMGFQPAGVLTAEIAAKGGKYSNPVQSYLVLQEVLERLQATPGVAAASAVNFPPMTTSVARAYAVDGKPAVDGDARPTTADYRVATPKYAAVMKVPVVQGRFISEEDRYNGTLVAVVNQRFADREWRGQNAIGKRISLYTAPGRLGPWRTVVGVVANVRHAGPGVDPSPEMYFPLSQQTESQVYLAVRTSGDPAAFAPSLQSVVKSVDAGLPLSLVRPMERVIADRLSPARFTTVLLAVFAAMALVLAGIGLYGVISYLVARRTQEFGVRIALGATPGMLLRLVLRRSLGLTGAGTALGLLAAFAVSRVLASVLPGVRADVGVFAAVAAVLVGIAGVAAWVPLRRALASGPLEALRSE